MDREAALGRALEQLARGAADTTVAVQRVTTAQWRWGEETLITATAMGLAGGVHLTSKGDGGHTLRYFMVGKDGLYDPSVVLG